MEARWVLTALLVFLSPAALLFVLSFLFPAYRDLLSNLSAAAAACGFLVFLFAMAAPFIQDKKDKK